MENRPVFEVHTPDGKYYRIYENGAITGFPIGSTVCNRIPENLTQAVAELFDRQKLAKPVCECDKQPEDLDSEDNWVHRSENMLCGTCMFSVEKQKCNPVPEEYLAIGRCRRHAPTLEGWPVIFVDDWCGDHKLDENKI